MHESFQLRLFHPQSQFVIMHLSYTCLILLGIFLHNNFLTESKIVSRDGIVGEAFKADAFRRITTHLIERHIVNKLGSCAFRCSKHHECVSFNFGNRIKNKHECQLLRTDKYNSGLSLVNSTDFHYFYQVNKCMDPSPCQNKGSCYPDYDNNDYHCVCKHATEGRNCEKVHHNCSELLSAGYTADGVYQINPDRRGSFLVYCDMTTDGGGWTVFQRNQRNITTIFENTWQKYKTGFGNLTGEFWLGLDKIYRLIMTKKQVTLLRVELEDLSGRTGFAAYSTFSIADESDFYRLHVSGYSGTAGDSIAISGQNIFISNNRAFSTLDKDNDVAPSFSCASRQKAGWWYGWCSISALNKPNPTWWSFSRTLKKTEMKLK